MKTLGLDLGRRCVRAVIGDNRRGRLELFEAATLPLPDNGADSLASAVGAFYAGHGRGVAQVVMAVPARDGLVKIVTFPATSEENLARLVQTAAETHLPLPARELQVAHTVVAEVDGQSLVAIGACRREALDQLLHTLRGVGVAPRAVDLSALALANVFAPLARERARAVAVLDLGDDDVQLIVLDDRGRLRQARMLGPDPAEIPAEVSVSFQAYRAECGQEVAELLVTGPGARDGAAVLADLLALPVSLGNPWSEVAGNDEHAVQFAIATGLALRGGDVPYRLDLKPAPALRARRGLTPAKLVLASLLALTLAGGAWLWQAWGTRRAELARLTGEVAAAEARLATAGGEDPSLIVHLRTVADEQREQNDWLELLKTLSERLPGTISLQELVCDGSRPVMVRGQAFTNSAIAQAVDVLNGLGRFAPVRLDYANAERIGAETVYNFQITCPWRKPTDKGGATP